MATKVGEIRTPYRLCCQDDKAVHCRAPSACAAQGNSTSKHALPLSHVNTVDIIAMTRRTATDGARTSRVSVEASRRSPLSLTPSLLSSNRFSSVSYLMEYQGFRTQEERNSMGYSRALQRRKLPVSGRKQPAAPATKDLGARVLDISRPMSLAPRYVASPTRSVRRSVTDEQSTEAAEALSIHSNNSTTDEQSAEASEVVSIHSNHATDERLE